MKKFFFSTLFMLSMFSVVSAQLSVEAGLTFQSKVDKAGIQVKGVYGLTETLSGAVGINFIFSESVPGVKTSLLEFNIDGHYELLTNDKFTLYPLAGLNITRSKVKFETGGLGNFGGSASKVGLNLGAGIALPISEVIKIVVEAKAVIASENASRIGIFAGANYAF